MSNWSRIVNIFRRNRLDREIDEEMQSHFDEALESGRDPVEARKAFGSPLLQRERTRDVRLAARLDSLRADVIFGFRQLRKNSSASLAAILSLALAMGAGMAAFRLIDALLLRPLPVAHADRLYFLTFPYLDAAGQTATADSFDYPQFRALRKAVKDDAELIAITHPSRNALHYANGEEGEKFWRQTVSGSMFSAFGLKPALGRLLLPSDDVKPGANPVAVLSYDYWTRRFGRDARVIGRKFTMGTAVYQIVGVAPEAFTGTEPGTVTDIFDTTMTNAQALENPHWHWFRIWVQLKPGRSAQLVREKLQSADHAYRVEDAKSWPDKPAQRRYEAYVDTRLSLEPATAGVSNLQTQYRTSLAVLGIVVLLVVLIACANIANLMTAQATARAREMALRVSIGAGRWRLAQLVILESALIAAAAGALGALFAWWSAPFVVSRINPPDNPARLMLPFDWRLLAFSLVLLVTVTALFSIVPALRISSVKPMSALRGGDEPHSKRRLMNWLIAAQVAFCILVIFVTGLFVTTFDRLAHQSTGFDADRLLTVETVTDRNKPSKHWEEVRQRLATVHGVESVAICGWALLTGNGWSSQIAMNGQWQQGSDETYFLSVSPGWLRTMKIPLIAGRDFNTHDADPGVAIVNEAFARRFFNGQNPLGRRFETVVNDKHPDYQIVGYVRDARYLNMRESIRPTAYVLFDDRQAGVDWATFVVRTTRANPMDVAQALRREMKQARPEFNVVNFRTQKELVEQHTVRERLLAMLSLFFAVVALVLAAVGMYGVLNYSVLQRRREIGIRMALGSRASGIARRVTSEVVSMLALGAVVGLAAGIASQRYLASLLYQVKATDLGMLVLPAVIIIAAALLAAIPPVIYAVRIDPAVTLRVE